LVALVAVVVLAAAGATPAVAGHRSKSCGVIAKGERDYRVKARAMRCKHARKWVRAYLRSRRRAPGFRCFDPPDAIPFFCARGVKAYWVMRL
jgi:hypothetical protein